VKHIFILILFLLVHSFLPGGPADTIRVNPDIELIKIQDHFHIHTTYHEFDNYGRAPSNGLVFHKNGRGLLIDTPNTPAQTATLVHFLRDSMHIIIEKVIVGHWHSDCMGGLQFLHEMGIASVSGAKTRHICRAKGLPVPKTAFSDSLTWTLEGEPVICRYFGAGHSEDNIVVYFPHSGILFGGCLIRSLAARHLGNTAEADIGQWDKTVLKLKKRWPEIKIVIPGHGAYGGPELIDRTIQLVGQQNRH
jgi:metallo-beta-lactamase class B